jgi:hypothetical protein
MLAISITFIIINLFEIILLFAYLYSINLYKLNFN